MTMDALASFTADDLRRLRTETFLREVEHHAEIGSTNDRALALCGETNLPVPYLILTEQQTAGRGRGANRWWSSDGALMFSVIINANDYALPESRWPQISLTVGAAVCEVLDFLANTTTSWVTRPDHREGRDWLDQKHHALPDGQGVPPGIGQGAPLKSRSHTVGLKWPNDVWLNHRKACGILVDVPPTRCGRLVIGIGLNVNNSFESAPAELQLIATSLCDETDSAFDRTTVLALFMQQLDNDLQRLAEADVSLVERWQSRCVLCDRIVSLDAGQRVVTGRCLGIAEDGALLLRTPAGEQRFYGGVIRGIE